MICIDLIFCTSQNVICNCGVDVSMFKKCHHNIIHGKSDIRIPLPPVHVCKSGIIKRQMLKILKKQYLTLTGTEPLKILL